jgi:hypothetical protein
VLKRTKQGLLGEVLRLARVAHDKRQPPEQPRAMLGDGIGKRPIAVVNRLESDLHRTSCQFV